VLVTHFDTYNTTDTPAAHNISIPSPAVVFPASRGHHHPCRSLTCSELSGHWTDISRCSSQCASTVDVTWLVHCCDVAVNNLAPMCHVAGPSHFVRVNRCTLVLDGPKVESVLSDDGHTNTQDGQTNIQDRQTDILLSLFHCFINDSHICLHAVAHCNSQNIL